MSYNISNWTTKKLDGLIIPLSAFYEISQDLTSRGWRPPDPTITKFEGNELFVNVELGEGSEVEGELLPDKSIRVTEISFYGEGSGTILNEIAKPALEQSQGILEAILVWESGDAISRLKVENGKVTEEDIEL